MSLEPDQVNRLRALKGAPLSILFALILSGEALGRDQLVLVTGWGKDKISEGLRVLEVEGLASPLMRYNGWELTSRARQLHLFEVAHKQFEIEGEKIAIADPASAAVPEENLSLTTIKAVAVVAREGEKIALDPSTLKELHSAGIGEPMASRLAQLPNVTAEYVHAHSLRAISEGITTGLLVHRIRSNDPAPLLTLRGHLKSCECDRCRHDRYSGEGVIH